MIICPKCKKELKDGSKFCDACGAKIWSAIIKVESQNSPNL